MEEHRASQVGIAVLYELKALLEQRAVRNRPRAVGGAAPGDYAAVPTLLAQMVLLDAGWDAINLGPNTPFRSFEKAILDLRPRLLWLSICHLDDPEAFVAGYRQVYECAAKAGVAVAIGGRALTGSLRERIPYTTFGDGMTQLAAFARTLSPRPTPPRRGRPRQT
jgi:methanogenic corrinoid protein MtbC1